MDYENRPSPEHIKYVRDIVSAVCAIYLHAGNNGIPENAILDAAVSGLLAITDALEKEEVMITVMPELIKVMAERKKHRDAVSTTFCGGNKNVVH